MASQTLNPSVAPTDVYGGDEVSAIVLDPGYSSIRAGFAGEDAPKAFVPSYYGYRSLADQDPRYIFGGDAIHNPSLRAEIRNPMAKDGTVEDWDAATRLWEYAITSRLTTFKQMDPRKNGLNDDVKDANGSANGNGNGNSNGDVEMDIEAIADGEKPLEEHPLLMTEPAWNPQKNREKAIETAMESWGCPAFWLAKNSVLAAFASGKATALVIDVGASTTSVIAIHDGLILKKSIQKSPLGGNWLSSQLRLLFDAQEPKVNLVPHYMIASKTPVDAGAPAQATLRKFDFSPHASFRALEEERVLTEFKEAVVAVWSGNGRLHAPNANGGSNIDFARSQPGHVFEFPDGANQMWGVERYTVAEGQWDASAALPPSSTSSSLPSTPFSNPTDPVTKSHTLPEMIRASLSFVDMDLRTHLLQHIVVTGGGSLVTGWTDRLNNELMAMYPTVRVKIQAAGLTQERRFGSWIGGSILGSLGTFHQMWISRAEYAEHGASRLLKS